MSDEKKPLPEAPSRPFGKKRHSGKEGEAPLMADRLAQAMAEGNLDEFMKSELPDSEHARKLVSMMMGMTGMTPPGELGPEGKKEGPPPGETLSDMSSGLDSGVEAPEEVVKAAREGDMDGLKELLRREHEARSSSGEDRPALKEMPQGPSGQPQEKELIDQLMKIAAENDVSMDWLVLRALRLYLRAYRETGRL